MNVYVQAVISVLIGAVLGAGFLYLGFLWGRRKYAESVMRLTTENDNLEQAMATWLGTFDQRVEQRVEEEVRNRDLIPVAEADFRMAEIMAARRETKDAGRLHPPRDDAGPPAKVSRIQMRRRNPEHADPK